MKSLAATVLILLSCANPAYAFIEAPHSVGRICKESTNIVVVRVERVDRTKNLIIYQKVKDLKGIHPAEQIKHNIGQKGYHPREWQNVMAWAKEGKRAVFFHNGQASLTGIDDYWYQCFAEGQWWAMSHAEPFLLRTYWGGADRLALAVIEILAGKEVIVPAMVDGPPEQYHLRTGKPRQIRASLKLLDYDPKRDFVAAGKGQDAQLDPTQLLSLSANAQITANKHFYRAVNLNGTPIEIQGNRWDGSDAKDARITGQRFENQKIKLNPTTNDASAKMIRSCVYGQGCGISLHNVPSGNYHVYAYVWEDNLPEVFDLALNGKIVAQQYKSGPAGKWEKLGPWPVHVTDGRITLLNRSNAAANLSGVEIWRLDASSKTTPAASIAQTPKNSLILDHANRRVILPCVVAPRKLPHLSEVYPLEVIATWPTPQGQKAHETVVVFARIRPSEVHAALTQLGLKPGKPANAVGQTPAGSTVKLLLEFPGKDGKNSRVPVEQVMIKKKREKPSANSNGTSQARPCAAQTPKITSKSTAPMSPELSSLSSRSPMTP